MTESRSFTFDWRRSEHARVSALLARELFAGGVRRTLKGIVLIIWVLGAATAIAAAALGDPSALWQLGPLLVVVGVLLAVFYRLIGWLQAWKVGRLDPNVRHPITHTLDASGFHAATRSAEVHIRWDGAHKVRETEDMFLVYYIPRYAYFLPKRAVGSPEQVEDLRSRIRGWLPQGTPYELDR